MYFTSSPRGVHHQLKEMLTDGTWNYEVVTNIYNRFGDKEWRQAMAVSQQGMPNTVMKVDAFLQN